MNKLVERIDDHITRSLANGEYGQPIGLLRDCKATINALLTLSTARQDALEEAAKWHDGEIAKLELQIQHNKDYSNRIGESENSIANEFCGHAISAHRTAAYQFRALKNKSAS